MLKYGCSDSPYVIGNMRAITAVNSEIEVPEGVSNNRAGPVTAKLGKQARWNTKRSPTGSILEQKRYRDERKKRKCVSKKKRSEGEDDRFEGILESSK